MATVTLTTATAMAPTYGVTRTITKTQTFVTTATMSAGDVYVFPNIRLPHRAIVTDIAIKGSVVDGTYIIEMGTVGSAGVIDTFGSKTFSATAVFSVSSLNTLPQTISVSDDAADRYQTFAIRVDGAATSGTTSVSLNFTVQYYCP